VSPHTSIIQHIPSKKLFL